VIVNEGLHGHNYREHGARNLVEHLDKERGLRTAPASEMSDEEIRGVHREVEEYEFEREVIISPQNGTDLSQDDQFSLYTRRVMSEFCKGPQYSDVLLCNPSRYRPSTHAQVALTGTKRDLWMDKEDCDSSASAPRAVPRPAS